MQKYILYFFLTIFAFSTPSFGAEDDEEDRPPNELKIRGRHISWEELLKVGRPGGLSPQTHQSSNKESPSELPCTRGTTFYLSKEKFDELFPLPQ